LKKLVLLLRARRAILIPNGSSGDWGEVKRSLKAEDELE
jgi:hypothetical protein